MENREIYCVANNDRGDIYYCTSENYKHIYTEIGCNTVKKATSKEMRHVALYYDQFELTNEICQFQVDK